MINQHVTMGEGGRIVIPAAYRKELGIKIGDDLILRMKDGEIHLFHQKKALSKLMEKMQKLKRPEQNMVDEFLKFRKEDSSDI